MAKLLINSRTSGKYHREMIDGRSHIVTQMIAIRGDTSMNNVFYSDTEVEASFTQLNNLPAPNSHPTVNGVNVLANHPVANNKHNVGGWLRNPRKKGKRVYVDFMLDEEIANNSEAGKEIIDRIENGKKLGVSTGLTIKMLVNKSGLDDFGVPYTREGSGFSFDHVAILLNERAAGEHAGTELITNSDDDEVMQHDTEDKDSVIDDVAELLAGDSNYKVTLDNGYIAVNHSKTTKEEVSNMDKTKIVLAIISNSANKFTHKDVEALNAKTDDELSSIIATNSLDEDTAKEFLATNSNIDFDVVADYHANAEGYAEFKAVTAAKQQAVIDNIVANSEFTAELLTGKSEAELALLTNMLSPKKAVQVAEQKPTSITTNSAASLVDYS